MNGVLISGFEAFDGRPVNGSWLAASGLSAELQNPQLTALQLPVIWGRAGPLLLQQIDRLRPGVVIALGEGKPGCIQLESLAFNLRRFREDNARCLPDSASIDDLGPSSLRVRAPLVKIRNHLVADGYPTLLSVDAGGFLCEEVLFQLEQCLDSRPFLQTALFIHLPPSGTTLLVSGEMRVCDEALFLQLARSIHAAVVSTGQG